MGRKIGATNLPREAIEVIYTAVSRLGITTKPRVIINRVRADVNKAAGREISRDTVEGYVIKAIAGLDPKKEDGPWCVGALLDIPPDALPDIFRVWRFTLALGHTLTVRQARWIARLRLLPFEYSSGQRPPEWLYTMAEGYAVREILSLSPDVPLDTTDLDAWSLPLHEYDLAQATGSLPQPNEAIRQMEREKAPSILSLVDPWSEVINQLGIRKVENVPSFSAQSYWTEKERYLYAYCLRYVTRAPEWRWQSLNDNERVSACFHINGGLEKLRKKKDKYNPDADDIEKYDDIFAVIESIRLPWEKVLRDVAQRDAANAHSDTA